MNVDEPARSATRFPLVGMLIALALLGGVGVVTHAMTSSQIENTVWVQHSHAVIETIAILSEHVDDARRSMRGYLLTGDRADLAAYDPAIRGTRAVLVELRTLTRDDPRQQVRLDRLEPLVQNILAHLASAIATRVAHSVDAAQAVTLIREGDARMGRVTPVLRELLDEEHLLLVARDDTMASGVTRTKIIQFTGTSVSLVLLGMAFVGLRREIRRRVASDAALRISEAATRELNDELERRVHVRTSELEASNRELEAFSYSVAHDLRAPLRSMSGFSEILLEDYVDKLDADGADSLRRIRDNARKMGVLIDALLSLSRITRSELQPATVDLSALVHTVANRLQKSEPRANVELVIADNIKADLAPDLARTLIEKLLDNAWKFTSKLAAPRIEFGASDADGQRTFFVRDNGVGFDMAHAAKLFVPFHRMHRDAEFPGTGIGLSIAQRIVARSGGTIWADGKVDQGASFYFTLSTKLSRTHDKDNSAR